MNKENKKSFKRYIPTERYMTERDYRVDYGKEGTSYPIISPHYHEFYELLLFISGNVDYIIGDNIYKLKKGDLLFIPPGVFHNPIIKDCDVEYERYVLWISVSSMNKIIEQDEDAGLFLNEPVEKIYLLRNPGYIWSNIYGAFKTLYKSYEEKKFCYKSECHAIVTQLMIAYNRELYYKKQNMVVGTRNTLLTNILHYINNNITSDLSLDKISSVFFTNKYTISHKFKEDMKVSYYQYVIQKRLSVGKDNLLYGMPVNKVHEVCGFSDYVCFYRAFKKEYGVCPTKFKKVHIEQMSKQ